MFLKLTSSAKRGIGYRGSRGHCVAIKQDLSELLRILPARGLQDYTTITVSWDRGTPPSENLARFCAVDKAKVLYALLASKVELPPVRGAGYEPRVSYSRANGRPAHSMELIVVVLLSYEGVAP
jgi:hypothetical protein